MRPVPHLSRAAVPALLAVALALGTAGCGSAASRKAIQKAQAHSAAREYEKALRTLNDAVSANPKDARLREARLVVLLEVERLDLARQEMGILGRTFPKKRFLLTAVRHADPRVRKGAAQLLGSLGDASQASALVPLLGDASSLHDISRYFKAVAKSGAGAVQQSDALVAVADALAGFDSGKISGRQALIASIGEE